MKNLTAFLLLYCSITLSAQQADRFTGNASDRPVDPRTSQTNFIPNEVLVKFKDEVTLKAGTLLKSAGISAVDKILMANGASSLEKLFPTAKRLKSAQFVKDPQGRDMKIPNLDNIYKISIPQLKSAGSPPPNIFKFIEELKALPEVEYAEPNYVFSIGDFKPAGPEMSMLEAMNQPANSELSPAASGLVPNDPLYNSQWGIPATKIDVVWNTTTGDSTAVIAILDTGVDWQHPDLAANIWKNKQEIPGNGIDDDGNGLIDDIRGWDYINNDNNPTDDNSHGTHVAGIAAAVGNNGIGIAGANWKARIMPIKVFQSSGKGDAATIAKGVTYAATNGATVINMSFGSYAESLTLKNALASAYATAVLVAAAGNDAMCIGPGLCPDKRLGAPMYPGGYSFVLGVEANAAGGTAGFSNFDQDGPVFSGYPDLFNYELKAPGAGILSCVPGGNYREYSGTSMAAPLVAGAVSLYRKEKPTESQELLFGNLINSISQHIDLEAALNIVPIPKLDIVSYSVSDTIDGDKDGRPDVGETIEIKVKVRNTWGQANDVKVGIEFGEFEDKTTATILTAEATVGAVSAYATKENIVSLKIKLAANINDGRDIVFKLKTWYGDHLGEKSQNMTINIENGVELKGIISQNMTLYPNKQYIVTDNIAIPVGVTLTIKPGTILKFGEGKSMVVAGNLNAIGKKDSLIILTKRDNGQNWGMLTLEYTSKFIADYIIYEYAGSTAKPNVAPSCFLSSTSDLIINNSQFKYNYAGPSGYVSNGFQFNYGKVEQCCFYYNQYDRGIICTNNFRYNNLISNISGGYMNYIGGAIQGESFNKQNIFSNLILGQNTELNISSGSSSGFKVITLDSLYYGTTNEEKINKGIYDFQDFGSGAWIDISKKMNYPSREAHGIVWKVLVNGKDAQDEFDKLDPLGVARQKFEVYFNRAMDPKFPPIVSMGVRYPYSQTSIADNGTWSSDSTIYTVYKNIGLTTGDGINTIRVVGAKDMDHFEIPIEDRRFSVIVNAANSASAEFMATPGLGKVKMEWNNSTLTDGLGFNMYRMEHVNDSVLTKPVLINSTLITDTLYTDFAVTPNKKYYYYYKILRTNLSETDSSKVVSATPFTASKGDANGDLSVNVLDITTIVAYLLNNHPQPFIAEAADYNSDNNINVLDIVGVVNFILNGGKKSGEILVDQQIHLYMKNDTLFADAPVAIGGIQFDLSGTTSIEEIQKLQALEGFESGYAQQENSLRLLYFSMSGKNIPAGNRIPLLKLKKGSSISEAIFANKNGTPIAYDFLASGIGKILDNPEKLVAELGQNYPNPLSRLTTIPIRIYEPVDEATIRIFNLLGQELRVIRLPNPIAGEHLLQWDSGIHKGWFVYQLTVRQGKKQITLPSRKMIAR